MSVLQFSRKNSQTTDVIANLDHITEVPYPLRKVQDKQKRKLRSSIQRNGYSRSRAVLTFTFLIIVDSNDTETVSLLVNDGVNKRLESLFYVVLVDWRHRFSSKSQLPSAEEQFTWQSEGLQMRMVIREDRQPMTARKIVILGSSCNTHSSLVLSESKFLNVLKTMLTFTKYLN